jgi:hypothetical protein
VTVKTCGTIANSLLGFVVPSTYWPTMITAAEW